jgi:hypothetical protein
LNQNFPNDFADVNIDQNISGNNNNNKQLSQKYISNNTKHTKRPNDYNQQNIIISNDMPQQTNQNNFGNNIAFDQQKIFQNKYEKNNMNNMMPNDNNNKIINNEIVNQNFINPNFNNNEMNNEFNNNNNYKININQNNDINNMNII